MPAALPGNSNVVSIVSLSGQSLGLPGTVAISFRAQKVKLDKKDWRHRPAAALECKDQPLSGTVKIDAAARVSRRPPHAEFQTSLRVVALAFPKAPCSLIYINPKVMIL